MEKKERSLLVLKYGAYTCAIALLFSFLLPSLGVSMGMVQNIIIIILGAEMYFCANEYKQKTQEPLSYKDAFALGWQVSFMAGLINAIIIFVAVKLMGEAEMLNALMKYKPMLIQQGAGDEKTVETLLRTISNPWFLFVVSNLFYLFLGLFLSLLVAMIVRTSNLSSQDEK